LPERDFYQTLNLEKRIYKPVPGMGRNGLYIGDFSNTPLQKLMDEVVAKARAV